MCRLWIVGAVLLLLSQPAWGQHTAAPPTSATAGTNSSFSDTKWLVSLGPAYDRQCTTGPTGLDSSEAGFGGFLSLERFIAPPVSARLQLAGTYSTYGQVLDQTDYLVTFGPRIYPLLWGGRKPGLIEPYIDGFIGGGFYEYHITPNNVADAHGYLTSGEALLLGGGAGVVIRLFDNCVLFLGADYYSTMTDISVNISYTGTGSSPLTFHQSAILITEGLGFRF